MANPVIVVGHKNPDNDSIAAAVGYAYLKNQLAQRTLERFPDMEVFEYQAARLGPLPPESAWILEKNGIEAPHPVTHVHARVADVMSPNPVGINQSATLIAAGRLLRKHNVRALVVTDDEGKYIGLISTRMIAERYIAAMDVEADENASFSVVNDLVASLSQPVSELLETDVLELNAEGLLKEAVEDLMDSALREAVVLDENGICIGIVTRSDVASRPKRKVILVDHNERSQAANGIDEAEVLEVIDHHRIGDISTTSPIQFMNLPVGSTATIVTKMFRENDVEIPPTIAEVLLSAIMTDTVILKSPTATAEDSKQVFFLSQIVGVDPTEFGLLVFQCRGGEENMDIEKVVTADSKEFQIGDETILICQHETVDLKSVLSREEELHEYMAHLANDHGYEFVLLLVTDILAEGSQFIVEGNHRMVDRVFGVETEQQSVWMPGILSRKKQVAARLLGSM